MTAAPRSPDRLAPDQPLPVPGAWRHPLLRLLAYLLAMGFAVGAAQPLAADPSAPLWLSALVLCGVVLAAYLAVSVLLEGRHHPHELSPRRCGALLSGTLLGGGLCAAVFALCWATGLRQVHAITASGDVLLGAVVLGPVTALMEELAFRGALFRCAEPLLGTWGSSLLTAALFGAAHLTNPGASWLGAAAIALEAGVALALLYAWSRNLWLVIGVHAGWNAALYPVFGSEVSGLTLPTGSLLTSSPAGPTLLSGGAFGLESSLFSILLWLAVSAWVLRRIRREQTVVAPCWVRRRRDAAY